MVTIAVIDDGISDIYFKEKCVLRIAADADGKISADRRESRLPTHGTLCAGIIRHYMPDCRLISIQVLNDQTRSGTLTQLLAALDWCAKHKIRLCNLSLGTSSLWDYFPLKKTVRRMVGRGQILVAAMGNDGQMLMPADLRGVISVKEDLTLCGNMIRHSTGRFREPDFYASSSHTLELNDGNTYTLKDGNSYAAAVVTAAAARIMAEYPQAGRDRVIALMKRDCSQRHFFIN